MTPTEEQLYIQGNRAAYRSLLSICIRELGGEDLDLPRALAEIEDVRRALRRLCADFGDNEWDDDLHLGDAIEKHLARHLHEEPESKRPWHGEPAGERIYHEDGRILFDVIEATPEEVALAIGEAK